MQVWIQRIDWQRKLELWNFWNPSMYECKCYKSSNYEEYLLYANCKCRKKTDS